MQNNTLKHYFYPDDELFYSLIIYIEKRGPEMKVIAVLQNIAGIKKILKHLKKGWSQVSLDACPGSLEGLIFRLNPDTFRKNFD